MSGKLLRDTKTAFTVLKRIVRSKISRAGVSVTYDCNQHCKTCDIWRINKENPELRKKEMTLPEFQRFCEANSQLIWIALTGGEPYLKKDLKGFMDACCSIPTLRLISITTNGSVPDKIESDVRHFLKNPNKDITVATQVSFEGPEKQHDEISGTPGSYQKALKSLRLLRKLEKEDSRIRTGISYTLSSFGLGGLDSTMRSLGPDCPPVKEVQIGIGQEAEYYQWKEKRKVVPEFRPLADELEWFRRQFSLKDKLDPYGLISDAYLRKAVQCYRNGLKFPRCVAAQYTCAIGPYWDVHPCLFMFQYSLGDLRDYDYNLQELLDETRSTWKPLVDKCVRETGCWTLCEDYCMILMRPWRVL